MPTRLLLDNPPVRWILAGLDVPSLMDLRWAQEAAANLEQCAGTRSTSFASGTGRSSGRDRRRVLRVQSGARRRGIVGIHGNGGNVESAIYRI